MESVLSCNLTALDVRKGLFISIDFCDAPNESLICRIRLACEVVVSEGRQDEQAAYSLISGGTC
jgi:hypothetical protein